MTLTLAARITARNFMEVTYDFVETVIDTGKYEMKPASVRSLPAMMDWRNGIDSGELVERVWKPSEYYSEGGLATKDKTLEGISIECYFDNLLPITDEILDKVVKRFHLYAEGEQMTVGFVGVFAVPSLRFEQRGYLTGLTDEQSNMVVRQRIYRGMDTYPLPKDWSVEMNVYPTFNEDESPIDGAEWNAAYDRLLKRYPPKPFNWR
jgi:hypothetical protein